MTLRVVRIATDVGAYPVAAEDTWAFPHLKKALESDGRRFGIFVVHPQDHFGAKPWWRQEDFFEAVGAHLIEVTAFVDECAG